ncbi:carboxylesterase/lipase family protein [Bdellovibrio sp. HCB337]|uniref:carboxylesterase/lipase family protein n=1 Tax=Bdellovibrio sp. HCB337 TaxID=3394358 RepID=UPI0039A4A666
MKTKTRFFILVTSAVFGLLSSAVAIAATVTATEYGAVSGLNAKYNTVKYLGIPYAAPPVGELRWKAPRDPQAWSGVLKAHSMKSTCLQKGNYFANVPSSQFGLPVGDEDCLYLNIWTPQKPNTKRPVVVWIHGGSNFKGTARDPMYEGSFVAAHSDVVFVSLNYRLGLLGAFTHEAFQNVGSKGDRSGNFTTLDLIQGLKWVRDNISQFSGDPGNITIMGQSAGCMNVWGLMQSPLAQGLFHKAVCSAGIPNSYPQMIAEGRSEDFLENLVVGAGLAKDNDEASDFLATQSKAWIRRFMYSRTSEEIVKAQDYIVPFQHINDGYVFPHGLEGIMLGSYNKVPLIMGSTSDEGTYLVGAPMLKPSEQELWDMIQNPPKNRHLTFDDLLTTDYLTFKATTGATSASLQLTLGNLYRMLRVYQSDVYHYSFEWKETPSPWHEIFGAVHGMDAIFYLGNFVTQEESFSRFAWTPENKESRERLRTEMNAYFTGFFWTGNPNSLISNPDKEWDHSIVFQ